MSGEVDRAGGREAGAGREDRGRGMEDGRRQPCSGARSGTDAVAAADAIQRRAADPSLSVVLRAAAGSGKTKVLVDRFIRLCLAGSPARSILAVTFTRKAAVEIQERLLARAGRYARLPEAELRRRLRDLTGREPDERTLRRAAGLHAELLQDLGGLPVGTIHSFCQQVVGRFALEAGLDPRFGILDDPDELWSEAVDRLERRVAADPDEAARFAALAPAPDVVRDRLREVMQQRLHLERWLDRVARERGRDPATVGGLGTGRAALAGDLADELRRAVGPRRDAAGSPASLEALLARLADALVAYGDRGLAAVLAAEAGGGTPALRRQAEQRAGELTEAAARLRARLAEGGGAGAGPAGTDPLRAAPLLDAVRGLLLSRRDGAWCVKGFRGGSRGEALEARRRNLAAAAEPAIAALLAAEAALLVAWNARLLAYGLQALDLYAELKRRDRSLDFQDLEHLAWRLLTDPELGPGIHYRLDARIDHLLVDEFQDTNENQWEIMAPLAREFLAALTEDQRPRTVFLVGDVKQSIYGFRGARPQLFGTATALIERHGGGPVLELPTNFRSLPAVVRTVGDLFGAPPLADLLPPGEQVHQLCARGEAPGRVHVLPPYPDEEDGESGGSLAAAACAAVVRRLLREGRTWEGRAGGATDGAAGGPRERPLRPSDILVLCRSRNHITAYEQALREAGVPIVPAGRGLLARTREIQDLLALLRWLAYPHDDAALAAVLRSPILRVPEPVFQQALAGRLAAAEDGGPGPPRRSLWEVVERHAGEPELARAAGLLRGWLSRAGMESCHDLLRRVYRTGRLPERFAAALGEQARYNLLRLHDVALSADLGRFPTVRRLADVLVRAAATGSQEEATSPEEEDGGRVRVMSIHQAKGLEAPVVLLVDADTGGRDEIRRLVLDDERADGPVLLGVRGIHADPVLPAPAEPPLAVPPLAEAGERARAFDRGQEANILYVALTRARDQLWVLGGGRSRKGRSGSFHDWIEAASAAIAAVERPFAGEAPAWLEAEQRRPEPRPVAGSGPGSPGPEIWDPPVLRERVVQIVPSADAVAEAADRPEPAATAAPGRDAREHGRLVHLWLQRFCEVGELPPGEGQARAEAAEILANPLLSWIFRPEGEGARGLSEVPFIHRAGAPGGEAEAERRVVGVIDRLVLRPGRADVIDFKTNRVAGEAAELALLRERYADQLRLYRAAVAALFPERRVGTHLLLTHPSGPGGRGLLLGLEPEADG